MANGFSSSCNRHKVLTFPSVTVLLGYEMWVVLGCIKNPVAVFVHLTIFLMNVRYWGFNVEVVLLVLDRRLANIASIIAV